MLNKPAVKLCCRGIKCAHYSGPLLPLTEFSNRYTATSGKAKYCKACAALYALRDTIKISGLSSRAYFQNKLDELERRKAAATSCKPPAVVRVGRSKEQAAAEARKRANAWYYANKDYVIKRYKASYALNKTRINQQTQAYYQLNIVACRQRNRDYARAHRRQNLERTYRWLELHPDKMRPAYIRRKWATSVYMRYSWQCIICESDQELNAHHCVNLTRLPEHLKWDTRVGVCLCGSCHRKFHSRYGKIYNTRKQLSIFIVSELLASTRAVQQVLVA